MTLAILSRHDLAAIIAAQLLLLLDHSELWLSQSNLPMHRTRLPKSGANTNRDDKTNT